MRAKSYLHARPNEKGFTLVELSLVMIISAVMLVTLMGLLQYREVVQAEIMDRKMDRILFGMSEYFRVFGHYPCPAQSTRPLGNSLFGAPSPTTARYESLSTNSISAVLFPPPDGYLCTGAGPVYTGDVPVRALNLAVGCLGDTVADMSSLLPSSLSPSRKADIENNWISIFIGRIQRNLDTLQRQNLNMDHAGGTRLDYCIPDSLAYDVYGNKFTYAVSSASVLNSTYAHNGGQIILQDQNGNSASANNAHFVIVSHGKDGVGAIHIDTPHPATPTIACNSTAVDGENCDGDNTFVIKTISDSNDNNQFDDIVAFTIFGQSQEQEIWERQVSLGGNEVLTYNPRGNPNLNPPLNIGRATADIDPATRLVVGGNVIVKRGMLQAGSLSANSGTIQVGTPSSTNVEANATDRGFRATQYCYETSPFPGSTGCD
jgi:prepilin-type N-terminal cleavage/methylation domain-containing protein